MLNRRRHPDDGVPRLSRSEAVRPRSGWARLCRLSRRGTLRVLGTVAIAVALAACGGDDEGVVPDFQLTDVNPNSETYNTEVSPRDYQDMISAWYFGSST